MLTLCANAQLEKTIQWLNLTGSANGNATNSFTNLNGVYASNFFGNGAGISNIVAQSTNTIPGFNGSSNAQITLNVANTAGSVAGGALITNSPATNVFSLWFTNVSTNGLAALTALAAQGLVISNYAQSGSATLSNWALIGTNFLTTTNNYTNQFKVGAGIQMSWSFGNGGWTNTISSSGGGGGNSYIPAQFITNLSGQIVFQIGAGQGFSNAFNVGPTTNSGSFWQTNGYLVVTNSSGSVVINPTNGSVVISGNVTNGAGNQLVDYTITNVINTVLTAYAANQASAAQQQAQTFASTVVGLALTNLTLTFGTNSTNFALTVATNATNTAISQANSAITTAETFTTTQGTAITNTMVSTNPASANNITNYFQIASGGTLSQNGPTNIFTLTGGGGSGGTTGITNLTFTDSNSPIVITNVAVSITWSSNTMKQIATNGASMGWDTNFNQYWFGVGGKAGMTNGVLTLGTGNPAVDMTITNGISSQVSLLQYGSQILSNFVAAGGLPFGPVLTNITNFGPLTTTNAGTSTNIFLALGTNSTFVSVDTNGDIFTKGATGSGGISNGTAWLLLPASQITGSINYTNISNAVATLVQSSNNATFNGLIDYGNMQVTNAVFFVTNTQGYTQITQSNALNLVGQGGTIAITNNSIAVSGRYYGLGSSLTNLAGNNFVDSTVTNGLAFITNSQFYGTVTATNLNSGTSSFLNTNSGGLASLSTNGIHVDLTNGAYVDTDTNAAFQAGNVTGRFATTNGNTTNSGTLTVGSRQTNFVGITLNTGDITNGNGNTLNGAGAAISNYTQSGNVLLSNYVAAGATLPTSSSVTNLTNFGPLTVTNAGTSTNVLVIQGTNATQVLIDTNGDIYSKGGSGSGGITNGVAWLILPASQITGSINYTNISNAVSILVQSSNNAAFNGLTDYGNEVITNTSTHAFASIQTSGNINITGQYLNSNGTAFCPQLGTNYTVLTNCTGSASNLLLLWIPTNALSDFDIEVSAVIQSNPAPSTFYFGHWVFQQTAAQSTTNTYTLSQPTFSAVFTNIAWTPGIFATGSNLCLAFTNNTGQSTNTIRVQTILKTNSFVSWP